MKSPKKISRHVTSESGWRNLPYYSGKNSTWLTIVTIINILALMYTYSEQGSYSETDGFQLSDGPASGKFYVYALVGIIVCLLDSLLINYEEPGARWAGRFLCCYTPAILLGYMVYLNLFYGG